MFERIVGALQEHPYLGTLIMFLLCGLGLPLPEELVLLAAGYLCAQLPANASLPAMMGWCAGAILIGDLLPFVLGRVFGVRLLRLRWSRFVVTKQRLANFDRWFRRRGDYVIFFARFLAGIRMVAFFTAGTMKMPWRRFLLLDGLGIVLIVPALTSLGYHGAEFIKGVVENVRRVEAGILWASLGSGVALLAWWWLWRRRRLRQRLQRPTEAFVQPQLPVQTTEQGQAPESTAPAAPRAEATATDDAAGRPGG